MTMEEKLKLLPELLELADMGKDTTTEQDYEQMGYGMSVDKEGCIRFCGMQWVRCVPLLPVHNQFACLEVENEKSPLTSLPANLLCEATQKSILTV